MNQNSENSTPDQQSLHNTEQQPVNNSSESTSGTAKHSVQNKQSKLKHTEVNGPRGLEPTRYGDWESKGRCIDF